MKDAIQVLGIMFGVAGFIILFMPWLIEYVDLYFTWVRSHFTH